MPKCRTVIAKRYASLIVAGICLVGLTQTPVRAAEAASLIDGQLGLELTQTIGYVDDYRQQYAACQTIAAPIAGSGQTTMLCPRPAAFGWLDARGMIRLLGADTYRPIAVPKDVSLLAQPNSDTVLVVDQKPINGRAVILRYYEHFTNHLSLSSVTHQLSLDDNISSLTLQTYDYLGLRQPGIYSDLQSNRLLLSYRGNLAWADLGTKTSGVFQTMPNWGGAYVMPSMALSPDGRTVVTSYPSFDLYGRDYNIALWQLDNCASGVGVCQRPLLDYLKSQVPKLETVGYERFIDNTSLEMVVGLTTGGSFPVYHLSANPAANLTDYLALGDSFASGEGAYQYLSGTDTTANKCHNSLVAYSHLLSQTAVSVACSGAMIDDINGVAAGQRSGWRASDFSPDQYAQLQQTALPGTLNQLAFASYFQPNLATVSMGGNDIGFADIIKACIDPRHNWQFRATCYPTYEDRLELLSLIRNQYGSLVVAYQQLLRRVGRLYVVGYPQIISASGSCGVNVPLNSTERVFAVQLTDYLDSVIKAAANTAGAVYVDVSQALAGRRLCESSQPAVNGVTAGDDALPIFGHDILGQESFHPNWLGQILLADAIRRQTANFTTRPSWTNQSPPAITDNLPILNAPKANRPLTMIHYQSLLKDIVNNLVPLGIHLPGGLESFAPQSRVTLTVYSSPTTIGTYQTNTDGSLDVQFSLPAGLPSGYHKLQLLGVNCFGEPLEIEQIIYITSAEDSFLDGALSVTVGSVRAGLALSSQTAMTPSVDT